MTAQLFTKHIICQPPIILLVGHRLGGMNVWDEEAGANQYQQANKQGANIKQHYKQHIHLNRHTTYIICSWVELYDTRKIL